MAFDFTVCARLAGSRARRGRLTTPHGIIETPEFLPVGTLATVKAATPRTLEELGVQGLLCNTYHLFLRPGAEVVAEMGGLHRWMGWPRPIMTDSGGFQAFSLGSAREHGVGKIGGVFPDESGENPLAGRPFASSPERLARIDDSGIHFRSYLDGTPLCLTPELSIRVQEELGADLILVLDECTSPLDDYDYTARALERTHRWAVRCLEARRDTPQALYGIVQGGHWRDLRERSARVIGELPFFGLAIGGSLGRSKADMHRVLEWTVPALPEDRPRHLLGIGEVDDLFECVERGVDTFDCVIPTRFARTSNLFVPFGTPGSTPRGTLVLRHEKWIRDPRPVDPDCTCYTCRHFSRSYLRHLYKSDEILAYILGTIHNLHFMMELMRRIRASLEDGSFPRLKAAWLEAPSPGRRDRAEG
jgi:queuine tRNA-ribosyltransferase/7-cyano-7-deazaguanine tRNA-ribosyltransferase